MYGDSFLDMKGSADVGSLTKEGMRAEKIRQPPKGEVEDFSSVPCKFYSSTSKQMQFPNYEKTMPAPNRRTYSTIGSGIGRFKGQSAY